MKFYYDIMNPLLQCILFILEILYFCYFVTKQTTVPYTKCDNPLHLRIFRVVVNNSKTLANHECASKHPYPSASITSCSILTLKQEQLIKRFTGFIDILLISTLVFVDNPHVAKAEKTAYHLDNSPSLGPENVEVMKNKIKPKNVVRLVLIYKIYYMTSQKSYLMARTL